MKQSAKTSAANPPATRPAVMFLRAVSRSTAGFLSVRAVRGSGASHPDCPEGRRRFGPGASWPRRPAAGRDGDPQAVAREAHRRVRTSGRYPVISANAPRAGSREGRGLAGRRPGGLGTRKLSPGRHPPLSPRPGQAVAVARGAGVRGVEEPGRGRHGRASGVTRIRDGGPTSSRRCRELRTSSRVVQHRPTRCRL
jgi:hypothetical protein